MSTRSLIGLENEGGTVTYIYCHSDGYLDHNGRLLRDSWTDRAKVAALMALGDISSLGAELGTKHSFDAREDNVVTAYGRDRGETGIEAKTAESVEIYRLSRDKHGAEYVYLMRLDGTWAVSPYDRPWKELGAAIKAEEDGAEDDDE